MTALFRKPPVEAVRWMGVKNCEEVFALLGWDHPDDELDHGQIHIPVPGRGAVTAFPGDWIVKDRHGEFEVCSDAEFVATYEPTS